MAPSGIQPHPGVQRQGTAHHPGTKTNSHYNIFGGNIGGPLFIPNVYNTDRQKTFFFWNEEWRKILAGAGTTNAPTLPLADHPVAGSDLVYHSPAFAKTPVTLIDRRVGDPAYNAMLTSLGLTPGTPFPNGTIPHQLFDSNAVLYLNSGIIPNPNTSDDKAVANVANPIDVRDDVVRVDHKVNDKWAILGHYMHDKVEQGYARPFLGWLGASYNTVTSDLSNPSNSAAIKTTGPDQSKPGIEASMNYDGNIIDITNSTNSLKPEGWTSSRSLTTVPS